MKTKKLLPVIIFSIVTFLYSSVSMAQAPSWLFAKSATGSSDDFALCVTNDASNNTIVVGRFVSPTITFGSTTLTNNTSTSNYADMYITKYDASGNVLWAKRAGGSLEDEASSVSTDAAGNIYVVGFFQSNTITFGSTTLTNADGVSFTYDMFIVKYDGSGNVVWAKRAGGTSQDLPYSVKTDALGNSYMVGYFYNSITMGATTLTASGEDMFVAKYDATGNVTWAKSTVGSASANAQSVTLDATGNILVAGWFVSPTIVFGSTTLTNTDASGSSNDMFILKYNTSGTVLMALSAGGAGEDFVYSITSDASSNIIVAGSYQSPTIIIGSTTLTNAGGTYFGVPCLDVFIIKYDNTGSFLWAARGGSGVNDEGRSVTTDSGGNIYVGGYFTSSFINWGTTSLTNVDFSGNTGDIYVVKFSPIGSPLWAKSAGGSSGDMAESVAIDATGSLYAAGEYNSSTIIFSSTTLTNTGPRDLFLTKMAGSTGVAEQQEHFLATIFPNPMTTQTIISFDKELKNAVLKIYNVLGEELKSVNFSGNQFVIEKGEMTKGIYSIQVIDENKNVVNRKIVVQ